MKRTHLRKEYVDQKHPGKSLGMPIYNTVEGQDVSRIPLPCSFKFGVKIHARMSHKSGKGHGQWLIVKGYDDYRNSHSVRDQCTTCMIGLLVQEMMISGHTVDHLCGYLDNNNFKHTTNAIFSCVLRV